MCVAVCEIELSDVGTADAGAALSGGEYSGFVDSGGRAGGADCDNAVVIESVDETGGGSGDDECDGSFRSVVHRSQMRSTVASDAAPAPDNDDTAELGSADDDDDNDPV